MGPRHRALFEQYVRELRHVSQSARAALAKHEIEQASAPTTRSPREVAVGSTTTHPAAHPRILGTITKYFFAAQSLNEELEREGIDEYTQPLVFVHEMLSGKHQDLWDLIAELPYLPLGLRPNGTWV